MLRRSDRALRRHVERFFDGQQVDVLGAAPGPVKRRVPAFDVLRVAPGARINAWTYISVGSWEAVHEDGHGLEFTLITSADTPRAVEVLAMNAYYHAGPPSQRLDVGHTVPIGEPWLPSSACDHLLASLPYLFGPQFEMCHWRGGHARLLWLLPITAAERDFKAAHGLDALEHRFESEGLDYLDPGRTSLVE